MYWNPRRKREKGGGGRAVGSPVCSARPKKKWDAKKERAGAGRALESPEKKNHEHRSPNHIMGHRI